MSRHQCKRAYGGDDALAAFTLIEVLIATAITGLIVGLVAATLMQFFQVSVQSTNRLAMLGDLTIAGQVLARDINSAQTAIVEPHRLTLTQPDVNGPARTVVYHVVPPELVRTEGGSTQTVARHLGLDTTFAPTGTLSGTQMVTIRFVATVGDDSVSATLQIGLRAQP